MGLEVRLSPVRVVEPRFFFRGLYWFVSKVSGGAADGIEPVLVKAFQEF